MVKQDILVLAAILLVALPTRADQFGPTVSSFRVSRESLRRESIQAGQPSEVPASLMGQFDSITPSAAAPLQEPHGTSSEFLSGTQNGLLWKSEEGRPSLNYKFSDDGPVMKLRGSRHGMRVIVTWGF